MSFFEELKRRNVFRVAVAYTVAAWVLLQVADLVLEAIEAPAWVLQAFMLAVALGFVAAVVIAWAYEMTPEGIRKESEVDRSKSITVETGRKLDRIIIGFLAVAVVVLLVERSMPPLEAPGPVVEPKDVSAETPDTAQPVVSGEEVQAEPSDNSIAVLPFANRSMQQEDLFFTDGIHDDLLTQLAKINNLKVISRTSVMEYRDTTKKIPDIAAELGVAKILEGGVQRAGQRVRINAQLIDVATDEHLWAETFDREMTMENIFDIQSEITRQIVTAVRGELTESESATLQQVPTSNLEAYEAYLHARASTLRADYVMENYTEAEPWALRAVELDPGFAEAWALLVEIHGQAKWMGYDRSPERRAMAEEALQRAKSLKPDSAIVTAAEADFYYRFEEDYEKALALFRQAHAAAPGDSRILMFMAITQRRAGYWDDAIESFERTLELDPSNTFNVTQLIDTLVNIGDWTRVRYLADIYIKRFPSSRDLRSYQMQSRIFADGDLEAARELLDRMPMWMGSQYAYPVISLVRFERDWEALLELLDTPVVSDFVSQAAGPGALLSMKGEAHMRKAEQETANSLFRQSLDSLYAMELSTNQENGFRWQNISVSLARLGEMDKAVAASERALEYMSTKDDHLFGAFNEANHTWILAKAGRRDEALERLEAQIDGPGGYTRWGLHFDPSWDFFRDDERFNELIRPENLEEVTR